MEIKEIKNIPTEVITDIICDSCGESCMVGDSNLNNKFTPIFEIMTLKANWGYGSKKDLEKWEAHLCEKCVDEKLSFIKFKTNVTYL